MKRSFILTAVGRAVFRSKSFLSAVLSSFCYCHETHPPGSNSHGCLTLHLLPPQRIRRGEKNVNERRAKSLKPTLPTAGHRFFGTVIASVLFMFIAGIAIPPVSNSSETDDSIEKIQKAYEKIRDMKGAFTQKNIIKDLNKTDTYKGEFFIKQPLKMKWLYTGKAAQDIYISNDTVMIYKKGDKQAYKGKFDKKTYGQTPIALLGGFGNIRQEFIISGRGNSLLLKPKSPLGNITSISITLSEDDFPIKSFTIQDGRSNVIEIVLKDVRVNTGLKDPLFEFHLPKEINVYEYNQ